MATAPFSPQEQDEIRQFFGVPFSALDEETFRGELKKLRQKYHPDNFEKFGDDTVREMATERFQRIEALATRLQTYFEHPGQLADSAPTASTRDFLHPDALFSGNHLKMEIITADKDLKYHLFGTYYRWLSYGESFKIPGTKASLVMDEQHAGNRIGYKESIRLYLTFPEGDPLEAIVDWFYEKIKDRATNILVGGDSLAINREALLQTLRKQTFLRIGPAQA